MSSKENGMLTCDVKETRNGHVVLDFGTYGQLVVAKKYLPKNVEIGTKLLVELLTELDFEKRKKSIGKAILEEIFQG